MSAFLDILILPRNRGLDAIAINSLFVRASSRGSRIDDELCCVSVEISMHGISDPDQTIAANPAHYIIASRKHPRRDYPPRIHVTNNH